MLAGIASAAVGVIGYFSSSRTVHRNSATLAPSAPAGTQHKAQPAGGRDRATHSNAGDKTPSAGGGSVPAQKK
jgi:hypothetical protein